MDSTLYILTSRQMALGRQLNSAANNMANLNTNGYKKDRLEFRPFIAKSRSDDTLGREKVFYVLDNGQYYDLRAAHIQKTDNTWDIALPLEGQYFMVRKNNQDFLTRNGQFRMDENNNLITDDGALVLDDQKTPITLPEEVLDVTVARNGSIEYDLGNGARIPLARLGIFSVKHNELLRKQGNSLMSYPDLPDLYENPTVYQGYLEASNVNAIEEMTRLIEVQRSFDYTHNFVNAEDARIKKGVQAYLRIA